MFVTNAPAAPARFVLFRRRLFVLSYPGLCASDPRRSLPQQNNKASGVCRGFPSNSAVCAEFRNSTASSHAFPAVRHRAPHTPPPQAATVSVSAAFVAAPQRVTAMHRRPVLPPRRCDIARYVIANSRDWILNESPRSRPVSDPTRTRHGAWDVVERECSAMLCSRCRGLLRRIDPAGAAATANAWVTRRARRGRCDGCGRPYADHDWTEIMLTMLVRLAGFGLASRDAPLLRPWNASPHHGSGRGYP